jgi:hypothetical protein
MMGKLKLPTLLSLITINLFDKNDELVWGKLPR